MRPLICLAVCATAITVTVPTSPSHAQTWTWTGGGATNAWDDHPPLTNSYPNWSPASLPSGDATVTFGAGFASGNPDIHGDRVIRGLTIATPAAFTLQGAPATLQIGTDGISRTSSYGGTQTISCNVLLGANQSWTIDAPAGQEASGLNVTGVVSGNFSISKRGAATLTLTKANTYSGGTTVYEGTLVVGKTTSGSATGTGGVIVKGGGTLAGNGVVAAGCSVSGTVAPGTATSHGPLTFQSGLTMLMGSVLDLDLNTGTPDLVRVSGGTLDIPSTVTVTVNLAVPNGAGKTYTILDATSASGSFTASQFVLGAHNLPGAFSVSGSTLLFTTQPKQPTGLSATAASATQVHLAWTANQEPTLAGYNIYRGTTSGFTPSAASQVATGVTGQTHTDTGLNSGTQYYYRITAVDTAGNESVASGQASAVTQLAAPVNLAATPFSASQINLAWTPSSEPSFASYRVYRETASGFTPSLANQVASGLTSAAFNDTGLAADTTYYYVVTAMDGFGRESAPSNEAGAKTLSLAPTGLTATAAGSGLINLTWTAVNDPRIAGYNVYRGTSSGFTLSPATLISAQVPGTTYLDVALADGRTYYYVVTSVLSGGGESSPSAEASATTMNVQGVIFVKADAAPGGDGTSWNTAYTQLQDALAVAGPGDQIWVARGTYVPFPPTATPAEAQAASFRLRNGVVLYGGFAGTEATSYDRPTDPDPYTIDPQTETVLAGFRAGNLQLRSFHVVRGSGLDNSCMLDGFTITGGAAIGPAEADADTGGGAWLDGGPRINNCVFAQNLGVKGAGIYVTGPVFVGACTFWGNGSGDPGTLGGAAYILNGAYFDSVFKNNAAEAGGAVYVAHGAPGTTLGSCRFASNNAVDGGVYVAGGNLDLYSCILTGNNAQNSGGAIFNLNAALHMANCVLAGNRAAQGPGGGIYAIPTATGGATTVLNCTFSGNQSGSNGAAVYSGTGAATTIKNSILFADFTFSGSGPTPNEVGGDLSALTLDHCVVQGGAADNAVIPNDPLFVRNPDPGPDQQFDGVNDDYGDLHLQPTSLAIDAGDNAAVPEGVDDLDGRIRIQGYAVDLGAYETIPSIAADFDHDGDIDQDDTAKFAACASGPAVPHNGTPDCQAADLDGDGDVDMDDFGAFQRCYSGANVPADPRCQQDLPRRQIVNALEDEGTAHEGVTITIPLDGQGTLAADPGMTATVTSLPGAGQLTQFDGAPITAVPAAVTDAARQVKLVVPPDHNGVPYATFQYTVTASNSTSPAITVIVNVTPTPDSPVCATPTLVTNEDQPAVFELAANDPDVQNEGDQLTMKIIFTAIRGALFQMNPDGSKGSPISDGDFVTDPASRIYYEPPANANGTPYETITYVAKDRLGYISGPCDVAIDVLPVNDPPSSQALTYTTYNDSPVLDIFLPATDPDNKPGYMDVAYACFNSLPGMGTLYHQQVGNPVQPGQCYLNGQFIWVLSNLYDVGNTSFDYYIKDQAGATSGVYTANIAVIYRNKPPVIIGPDLVTTQENTPVDIAVQATDPDGDLIQITVTGLPQHGQLYYAPSISENCPDPITPRPINFVPTAIPTDCGLPGLRYVPEPNYTSGQQPDSFELKASDSLDTGEAFTVHVNVTRQ